MKKSSLLCVGMAVIAMVATGLSVASCGDNDDEQLQIPADQVVNTAKVFTAGLPKSFDGKRIEYDSRRRVTKIQDQNSTRVAVFEYPTERSAMITLTWANDVEAVWDITIGDNGFASSCRESLFSSGQATGNTRYTFGYDDEGHLETIALNNENHTKTVLEWKDGNVVSTATGDDSANDIRRSTFAYTSKTQVDSLENKGGVMLYELVFDCGTEMLDYVYYAGMLGMPTRLLPVVQDDAGSQYTLTWKINASGLATRLSIGNDAVSFGW